MNTGHARNTVWNLATNPCPCGDYAVAGGSCTCPPAAIRRYLAKLSGPLLDRIDIELSLARVSVAQHANATGRGTSSADAKAQVAEARSRSAVRLRDTPWHRNADVPGTWLRQGPLSPPPIVRRPLDAALARGGLTLRGYDRVLRVAWSVADLEGSARLTVGHIGRALFLKKGITA